MDSILDMGGNGTVRNASESKSMERRTGDDQAVFDTRTLVALALPRAGTPVFRAY